MGYTGFDEDYEAEAPKWLAKAKAKRQSVPAVDARGVQIPLSAFGQYIDDRDVFKVGSHYFVRTASSVGFFTGKIREKGYEL